MRVTGPFTVEGVRPEELSLGEDGLFDPTPNEFEPTSDGARRPADRTLQAYLAQMVQHLRTDGLTFLGNKHRKFSRLDPLFEERSGSLIHAEGSWEGDATPTRATPSPSRFGPQYGPVTALQVEEAIRAAKQYDELVIAGFSFDAEAYAVVEEQSHPKLRIHMAQIRPDLNQAMEGLLKDTPNSQLFTVFGQPDVEVKETKDGWICTLNGVDIYNPVDNTVRSSGADKVAAWFLDSDFDGRCFCITQAFFPDQNAWEKIAKALGSSADPEAFEAFKGTTSLPFPKGKYGRIAVKVIDPRGNEVMAVRKLELSLMAKRPRAQEAASRLEADTGRPGSDPQQPVRGADAALDLHGRRAGGRHGTAGQRATTTRPRRSAAGQQDLLAEEERDDLELVNRLREDVKRWRECGLPRRVRRHPRPARATGRARTGRAACSSARSRRSRRSSTCSRSASPAGSPRPATRRSRWTQRSCRRCSPATSPPSPPQTTRTGHAWSIRPASRTNCRFAGSAARWPPARQDRRDGDAHHVGVLQPRPQPGQHAVPERRARSAPEPDRQGAPAGAAARASVQLLRLLRPRADEVPRPARHRQGSDHQLARASRSKSEHSEGDTSYRVVQKGEETADAFTKDRLGDLAARLPDPRAERRRTPLLAAEPRRPVRRGARTT